MDKVLRTICLKKVVANKQGGTKRKLKSRLINKSERMGTNLAVETPTFLSCTVTSTCWFAIMATMQFQLNLNSAILTCYWVQTQLPLTPNFRYYYIPYSGLLEVSQRKPNLNHSLPHKVYTGHFALPAHCGWGSSCSILSCITSESLSKLEKEHRVQVKPK